MWNIILIAFAILMIFGAVFLSFGWAIPVIGLLLVAALFIIPALGTAGHTGTEGDEFQASRKPSWLRKHWWQ